MFSSKGAISQESEIAPFFYDEVWASFFKLIYKSEIVQFPESIKRIKYA